MRKSLITLMAVALVLGLALPSLAGNLENGTLSGPHYTLNIHGVTNPKTAKMTGNDGHSIFIGLGAKGVAATTRIYLVPPPESDFSGTLNDFKVCDANGFDYAYNCAGTPIKVGTAQANATGATFQLPCNTNIVAGTEAPNGVMPCDINEKSSYSVWLRELGKPMEEGAETKVSTCAYEKDTDTIVCSSDNLILVRNTGREYFRDVTQELTSLVAADGKRYALFRTEYEDWFWKWENEGLKLAQLRFYME